MIFYSARLLLSALLQMYITVNKWACLESLVPWKDNLDVPGQRIQAGMRAYPLVHEIFTY